MIEYLPCSHEELPRSLRWDVTSRDPDPLVEVAYAHREIESDEAIRGAAYRRARDRCTGEAIYARRADVADVDVRVLREVGQRRRVTREHGRCAADDGDMLKPGRRVAMQRRSRWRAALVQGPRRRA